MADDTNRAETRVSTTTGGREAAADGGEITSPFDIVSDVEETRMDRYKSLYNVYVSAPISILRSDPRAVAGLSILVFYVVMGVAGPRLVESTSPNDGLPYIQPFENPEFPLGTDALGQDLMAQTIYSTMPILQMILSGAVFTVIVATIFGTLAGYKGGMVDTVLSTITDTFINIPGLPLVIVLSVLFEPQDPYLIGILLTVAAWAGLARALRSQVLTLRDEEFTEVARAMGVPTSTLLIKDIVPHLMPYIMINFVNTARYVIFSAVGLYFLGVLPFQDANWGVMLNQAYQQGAHYRPGAVHWLIIPMVAIIVLSMGLILLAQSLDRVFNPRVRGKHMNQDVSDETEGDEGAATDPMIMQ